MFVTTDNDKSITRSTIHTHMSVESAREAGYREHRDREYRPRVRSRPRAQGPVPAQGILAKGPVPAQGQGSGPGPANTGQGSGPGPRPRVRSRPMEYWPRVQSRPRAKGPVPALTDGEKCNRLPSSFWPNQCNRLNFSMSSTLSDLG